MAWPLVIKLSHCVPKFCLYFPKYWVLIWYNLWRKYFFPLPLIMDIIVLLCSSPARLQWALSSVLVVLRSPFPQLLLETCGSVLSFCCLSVVGHSHPFIFFILWRKALAIVQSTWILSYIAYSGCNGTNVRRVGRRRKVLLRRFWPVRGGLALLLHIRSWESVSELEGMEKTVGWTKFSYS